MTAEEIKELEITTAARRKTLAKKQREILIEKKNEAVQYLRSTLDKMSKEPDSLSKENLSLINDQQINIGYITTLVKKQEEYIKTLTFEDSEKG